MRKEWVDFAIKKMIESKIPITAEKTREQYKAYNEAHNKAVGASHGINQVLAKTFPDQVVDELSQDDKGAEDHTTRAIVTLMNRCAALPDKDAIDEIKDAILSGYQSTNYADTTTGQSSAFDKTDKMVKLLNLFSMTVDWG